MKNLISLLFLLIIKTAAIGQIAGNGEMVTTETEVNGLRGINIQLNADVILDYNQKELMTISTDANVIDYIGINFENGILTLDQKKWIRPSKQPVITVGSPDLVYVFQGTHSTTKIKNVNAKDFTLAGNVGTVMVEGRADRLSVETENTTLDLRKLAIQTINIEGECTSKILLGDYTNLIRSSDSRANIRLVDGSRLRETEVEGKLEHEEKVQFIEFKIKNNSIKRNSFYVKGPNGRGGMFSYGFSMMPYSSRDENWSIGTKIFQEARSGQMIELLEVTSAAKGNCLDLFE